jgi:hypothetical protein
MVGASGRATACVASVAAVEPTPIFAALVAPGAPGEAHGEAHGEARGQGDQRRTVTEILRALRTEQVAEREAMPPIAGGRVGHVPGVLSFRPSARG